MDYRIKHGPVFSILEIDMSEADVVVAQPNSMLTMTPGIHISARVGRRSGRGERGGKSGFFSGFRNLLGGENFFTAEFLAKRNDQILTLAPQTYGDILRLQLVDGESGYYLTRGSYLANIGDCELKIKYSGLKGLMSRKGLFLMHAIGEGSVFCQAYGAVVEQELADGEHFLVDNRFMIAFSDTVSYQLVKATKSVKDTLMSGEGLVNKYTGPGRLFYQTRGKQTGGILSAIIDVAT
jgi:uncharacterized protein (TIGR00266 family)